MNEPADTIRYALARYLDVPVEVIELEQSFAEHLSLEPLDVVVFAIGLEGDGRREFPIEELGRIVTVRDLVVLYEAWLEDCALRDDIDEPFEDEPVKHVAQARWRRSRPRRSEGVTRRHGRRVRRWERFAAGHDGGRR